MKKWIWAIALSPLLYWGYNSIIDGFSPENIRFQTGLSSNSYYIPHSEQELELLQKAANQPFSYLGKGRQSYAFISEDGQWVLKFFKCQRLKLSALYTPLEKLGLWQEAIEEKKYEKEDRLNRLFQSAYIAATILPKETGIAFANFQPGNCILPKVTLINRAGIRSTVDLNQTPFCLQKRGEPLLATFERELLVENRDALKARINQIIALMKAKRSKGIIQHDPALVTRNNIGFTEDSAIFIDIGSFGKGRMKPNRNPERQQLKPLMNVLIKQDPELAAYLQSEIDSEL